MTCDEIMELCNPYIDGELSEETRARVERHLITCEKCAYEVRSHEQMKAWTKAAFRCGTPAPDFREKAAARLHDAFEDVLIDREPAPDTQWALPFFRGKEELID